MAFELELDQTNRSILAELQSDARISKAELGRRVGLSPPAVVERVQRLEAAGVISGYRAQIDPVALGYALTVIVRVRPTSGRLAKIAEIAEGVPQLVECYRVTGEDCFHMKLHLKGIDELGDILDAFLDYGQTTTSIIQSAYVDRPLPVGKS